MSTTQNSGRPNGAPYLRTSREFPEDPKKLTLQISKSYIEIANAVNSRTISIFPISNSIPTGETWYINSTTDLTTNNNQRQQTVRQVYVFSTIDTGATLYIPHYITNFVMFSKIYGTCYTNLPDYRPIPYASVAANTNIDVRVDTTNIYVANGTGSPQINSGMIILEWLTSV